jgi:hypothetical protein
VRVGDRKIPVREVTKRGEPGYGGTGERYTLIRVRPEEFRRQLIGLAQYLVEIRVELVFVVASWQYSRVVDATTRDLRARNHK